MHTNAVIRHSLHPAPSVPVKPVLQPHVPPVFAEHKAFESSQVPLVPVIVVVQPPPYLLSGMAVKNRRKKNWLKSVFKIVRSE